MKRERAFGPKIPSYFSRLLFHWRGKFGVRLIWGFNPFGGPFWGKRSPRGGYGCLQQISSLFQGGGAHRGINFGGFFPPKGGGLGCFPGKNHP